MSQFSTVSTSVSPISAALESELARRRAAAVAKVALIEAAFGIAPAER